MKQKKIITLILGLLLTYILVMPIHSQLEPLPKGWGQALNPVLLQSAYSVVRDTTGKIYVGYKSYIIVLDGQTSNSTMFIIDTIKIPDIQAANGYPQLAIDKNNNLWIHWLHRLGRYIKTDTGLVWNKYRQTTLYFWDAKSRKITERNDVYSYYDTDTAQYRYKKEQVDPLTINENNVLYFYDYTKTGIIMHDINNNKTNYYKVWDDSLSKLEKYKGIRPEYYEWFIPIETGTTLGLPKPWRLGKTNIFFSSIFQNYPGSYEDTASWYDSASGWDYAPYYYSCIFKYDPYSCVSTHKIYDFMEVYGTRGTNEKKAKDNPIEVRVIPYPNKENNIYVILYKMLTTPPTREIWKYNPQTDSFAPTDECDLLKKLWNTPAFEIPYQDSTGRYIVQGMANTGDSLKRRALLKYYDSNGNFLDSVKLPITNVSGITSITGDVVFFANSLGLYWFDPNIGLNDISDETESSYVDVWINSAYPNPVSNRLNIDILYYPSSILGNDLQVDLYNSIGQKVLDITPLGEYSESRNLFEANIDIPKHIPTGSYVISAVSGNVRRIRGIMIINK